MKKIVINLGMDKEKAVFKIGPLSLPRLPRMELPFRADKELPIYALRQLLSDEKARILHTIAVKEPESVYKLAKYLGRDFKAVRQDIKTLEQFGLVKLVKQKSGKRPRLKPLLPTDEVEISLRMK